VGRLWWLLNGGGKSESLLERSERDVGVSLLERAERGVDRFMMDINYSRELWNDERCHSEGMYDTTG